MKLTKKEKEGMVSLCQGVDYSVGLSYINTHISIEDLLHVLFNRIKWRELKGKFSHAEGKLKFLGVEYTFYFLSSLLDEKGNNHCYYAEVFQTTGDGVFYILDNPIQNQDTTKNSYRFIKDRISENIINLINKRLNSVMNSSGLSE